MLQLRSFSGVLVLWVSAVVLAILPAVARGEDPKVGTLKIGSLRVSKVLFLGNSITLHGPAPAIGWTGEWGMAASAKEKDYVHLLTDKFTKAAGKRPEVKVRNIADFERGLGAYEIEESLKGELEFQADLIIIAIGENSATPTTPEARKQFFDAVRDLFSRLTKDREATLIVRSQFWVDGAKDELLKKACDEAGGIFVDLGGLGTDPANAAKSERAIEHEGVGAHPGDKGMAAIADKLWEAILRAGKVDK